MLEQHTPGPWKVVETRQDGHCIVDAIGQNVLFAIPAAAANARLSAAAPALLDALQALTADEWVIALGDENERIGRLLVQARTAIANADGGAA